MHHVPGPLALSLVVPVDAAYLVHTSRSVRALPVSVVFQYEILEGLLHVLLTSFVRIIPCTKYKTGHLRTTAVYCCTQGIVYRYCCTVSLIYEVPGTRYLVPRATCLQQQYE